jgi:GntR family transcriptional regulator
MKSSQQGTVKLERAPGTSLHRQLFIVLREQITRGLYIPGSLIPTEEELCNLFGVSRITVRRALTDLEQNGLVEKRQGRGTFVSADLPTARPAATLNLIDSLKKHARETKVKVLNVEITDPPGVIALQLHCAKGERAVHASRLRFSGKTVLMVTEAWVPEKFGKRLTTSKLQKHALYEILLAEGVKFERVVQEITAVAAAPYYAKLLNVEVGMPLLRLTRLLYDHDSKPVLHFTAHVSPERSRILMDISADTMNTLAAGHVSHDLLAP